jgi:hypothetical protein
VPYTAVLDVVHEQQRSGGRRARDAEARWGWKQDSAVRRGKQNFEISKIFNLSNFEIQNEGLPDVQNSPKLQRDSLKHKKQLSFLT